tara:strand:+ start:2042 stop:2953 length:912 start_codon:yes stop_codon:yes gene_type:complete
MTTIFKPKSLVFVRICPKELTNVYDARLMTHLSNLAFSSQISANGFYTTTDFANYTLNGTSFNNIFFARHEEEDDPLFAIKQSNAQQIIFTNTPMAAGTVYTNSPEITGPVITYRGDKGNTLKGINLMDNVVHALECDLNAKASDWDSISYNNIVLALQPIRALSHLLTNTYSSAIICSSLSRSQIAIELAKIYDSHNGLSPSNSDSAQKAIYAQTNSNDMWNALMTKLDGSSQQKIGYLAISILFRNSTPRAKDYEFKIHIKISSNANSQDETAFLSQHSSGFSPGQNVQISGFTFKGFNSF